MDQVHRLTLADVLREHARSRPLGEATVDGTGRLTYPELDERTSRLADALRTEGFGPGDRILWLGQNSSRLLECLLAAAKLGGSCCPVNWRQSPEELAFVIDDVAPTVAIWQEAEIGDPIRAARELTTSNARWLRHDTDRELETDTADTEPGVDGYEAFLQGGRSIDHDLDVDPATGVLIVYTAAFGGVPNGALLSHTACILEAFVMAGVSDVTWEYRYLNCGPMFHVGTLMLTLAAFVMGGTNVFTPRVDAEELCRLIETERCTGAFLQPPTIQQILELNGSSRYDLSSLRTHGGTPEWNEMITVDTSPRARRRGGYGQTEVMGLVTFGAFGPGDGAKGWPSPLSQVRVVDPAGADVTPGEVGEIAVRGPTVMAGYHRRDDENARRHRGGWHHTTDLGRREADGSITFIGPMTRIVKSAAENIYPAEVEGCLKRHAAVKDAAIIGVPDAEWTQSVKAIVVLEDGATASAEDLIEYCRSAIASYKKPRTVEFTDALPRAGPAVDYDALDAAYGGGGYPGKD
jgi:long-chain acyl-CoA synthetase